MSRGWHGRHQGVVRLGVQTTPDSPGSPEKTRIAFIDIGRSIAALLVFYTHIPGPWVRAKGEHAPVIDFIETFTSEPMHMAKQGIGQLSVPFFFLVSGFVVTPIALRQGHRRFAINRFIRVYLPLGFVLLLTSLALWAQLEPQSTGQSQELTPWTMFTNWMLVNYLLYPQVVLMPVAWTMIIEVLFYAILFVLLPVLRRSVWLTIAIELTFVFVVLMSRSALNESYSLFAVNVSYLPIMIIGQTIWAVTTKRIPLWVGGVFGALAWMLYVLADIIDVGRIDDSYNLALAFAVACFLLGMFAEPKLKQRRIWTELSERSYSLYLLHALVLFVVLGLLRPAVPFAIALPITIVCTFAVVEVSYRFVERPSHSLARKLSRLGARSKDRSGQGQDAKSSSESVDVGSAQALANEITLELPRIEPAPRRPPRQQAQQPGQRPRRPVRRQPGQQQGEPQREQRRPPAPPQRSVPRAQTPSAQPGQPSSVQPSGRRPVQPPPRSGGATPRRVAREGEIGRVGQSPPPPRRR
ncbi:peptidoglycan/LPS O-acetylase OafA/YrhL [Saccharomonospora amisosensis]|uniref:Peptidoglycan/LPS O-acetylase OafA/YrhL n=1 Tax=Saccharomonospora amisosensis TaxID=1128677 RepID=A0A7X5UUI3_9PSEU|nr:acyltransferase family protein [Saccharomonospora amisosensis]NIJ14496.1 peptidoglycan/LPS O-acetylase OafA/YrhL [Saccharomonospora amisosensis]